MNALDLLQRDHRTVEALFRRFERETSRDRKRTIVDELVKELSVHAAVEEQFLYPAIRERIRALEDNTLEALEEHHAAKVLIKELEKLPKDHERFDAKVSVLQEMIRHHVEEEEGTLFPKMRRNFEAEELEILGLVLEEAKKTAPTRAHPLAPDEPPGVFAAGGLAAILDRGRDMFRDALKSGAESIGDAKDRGMETLGDLRDAGVKRAKAAMRPSGGRKQVQRRAAARTGRKTAAKKGAAKRRTAGKKTASRRNAGRSATARKNARKPTARVKNSLKQRARRARR